MKRSTFGPWLAIALGGIYFIVPLIGTFEFSLRMKRDTYSFEAYRVVLTDPKGAIPPYDAVILVSPKAAADRRLVEVLRPLVGAVPVEAMRAANYSVDRDTGKSSPGEAARALERAIAGH